MDDWLYQINTVRLWPSGALSATCSRPVQPFSVCVYACLCAWCVRVLQVVQWTSLTLDFLENTVRGGKTPELLSLQLFFFSLLLFLQAAFNDDLKELSQAAERRLPHCYSCCYCTGIKVGVKVWHARFPMHAEKKLHISGHAPRGLTHIQLPGQKQQLTAWDFFAWRLVL